MEDERKAALRLVFFSLGRKRERAGQTPGRSLAVLLVPFCNVTKGRFLELEQAREVTDGLFSSLWSSLTGRIVGGHSAAAETCSHRTSAYSRFSHVKICALALLKKMLILKYLDTFYLPRACGHLHRRRSESWICSPSGFNPDQSKASSFPP